MNKSSKLPKRTTQKLNHYTAANGVNQEKNTDTTPINSTLTTTHIFNK